MGSFPFSSAATGAWFRTRKRSIFARDLEYFIVSNNKNDSNYAESIFEYQIKDFEIIILDKLLEYERSKRETEIKEEPGAECILSFKPMC